MKNPEAIARTRARLQQEFEAKKARKLEGLRRHRDELQVKITKLQSELTQIESKITEIESEPFRDPIPSEDQRRQQSQLAKQSRD